jgi:hypothetical protein
LGGYAAIYFAIASGRRDPPRLLSLSSPCETKQIGHLEI